jgi:hypothetical protein
MCSRRLIRSGAFMGDFSFCCPCPVKVVPAPDFCGAKAPAEGVAWSAEFVGKFLWLGEPS